MTEQNEIDRPVKAPPGRPKKQLTRKEKMRNFLIGFVGWWLITALVWLGVTKGGFSVPSRLWSELLGLFELLFLLFFFVAQLGILIILAFRHRWIALGMVSALALNLAVTLVMGLGQNAFCFAPFFVPL